MRIYTKDCILAAKSSAKLEQVIVNLENKFEITNEGKLMITWE